MHTLSAKLSGATNWNQHEQPVQDSDTLGAGILLCCRFGSVRLGTWAEGPTRRAGGFSLLEQSCLWEFFLSLLFLAPLFAEKLTRLQNFSLLC